MTGPERRTAIINQIKTSSAPVPGKALAAQYEVSRQVILHESHLVERIFKVKHTDDQVEDELYTIVDLGGRVRNVMVNHRVYGHMEASLNINSRRNAAEFIDDIRSGKSTPLKNITSNYHYHVVEADSEKTLDMIQEALEEKGFLLEQEEWEKELFAK